MDSMFWFIAIVLILAVYGGYSLYEDFSGNGKFVTPAYHDLVEAHCAEKVYRIYAV
jgi:hypothetical protein